MKLPELLQGHIRIPTPLCYSAGEGLKARSRPMRYPIKTLVVWFAAVLIFGCSSSWADTKKPKPKPDEGPQESVTFSYGAMQSNYYQQKRGNPTGGKPTTSGNPALQGSVLQKSGGVGSPVKPGYDLNANKGAR